MVTREIADTISVVTNYSIEDSGVIGHLIWPEQQPQDIYTLDVNGVLSIALDKHFPIRPSKITWEDGPSYGTEKILGQLFGEELTTSMIDSRQRQGLAVVNIAFNQDQRLAIAEIQVNSPSTPPQLKRMLYGMYSVLRKTG
jgi:hypothetical protein